MGLRMTAKERVEEQYRMRFIGPQQVGGRYLCAYWRQEYTVDAIEITEGGSIWFSVTWADGHKGRHCTSWDRRDKVIRQPEPA